MALRKIVDTTLIAAMGPPSGGRKIISSRFLRHFHVLSLGDTTSSMMTNIFNYLMTIHSLRGNADESTT
jgi:dynein heavy chain